MLGIADVHFGRGPFGKLHVRFGKGARTLGPRPQWVPMLDGLDVLLRWFLDDVRGRFPRSAALFCDESGGQLAPGTVRNRLRHLMSVEGRPETTGSPCIRCAGLFVSLMSHHGVSIKEIARVVGHASTRTTEVVYRRELRPVITTDAGSWMSSWGS